ncbi:GDSL esterase/lipase At5g55050-like [Argentina anserina]|uniref:GDSL esterase/lipase At5g55050-like n=1 Tax=Argentina anserina TaxID=57926 RepID=UPI00217622BF|nr:GDSL esterase/lipase At5g55050-like [Potentilla anserina]
MAKSAFLFLWLNIILYLCMLGSHISYSQSHVPALYIFGDSTADVGTNHYLPGSRAKADFLPNGIDFSCSKPTGRFSNGYNTIDFLAQHLDFDESPPPFLSYLDSSISQFLITNVPTKGINFASGGSGLMDHTGEKWGRVISFTEQVQQFSSVRSNISELLGASAVANISKSLFIISVGSNDIFDHFDANHTGRKYISTLISTYETHLRNLYDLGARKFGIVSVGAIGCCPVQRNSSYCNEAMNEDAQLFYSALRSLLRKLSSECKGLMYALADSYQMSKVIIDHPTRFRHVFTEMKKACCGKGKLNAQEACKPGSDVCKDRTTYLFWDQYHPTERASYFAALELYAGTDPELVPMNFGDLACHQP